MIPTEQVQLRKELEKFLTANGRMPIRLEANHRGVDIVYDIDQDQSNGFITLTQRIHWVDYQIVMTVNDGRFQFVFTPSKMREYLDQLEFETFDAAMDAALKYFEALHKHLINQQPKVSKPVPNDALVRKVLRFLEVRNSW